jgi:hypothetical protein
MKNEVEGSKKLLEGLADAGARTLRVFGRTLNNVGRELQDDDEDPVHVLASAALGLERAHADFVQRALGAVTSAIRVSRKGPPPPKHGRTTVREPRFELYRSNTVTITGTVEYEALARQVNGFGVVPVKLVRKGEPPLGVVQVYFNDVANGYFGPCKEMLVAASVVQHDRDPEVVWKDPDNRFYPLVPTLGGQDYLFALQMLVDGPREDIEFGQDKLALAKFQKRMPNLSVGRDGAILEIEDVVKAHLFLHKEEARRVVAKIAAAMGKTTGEFLRNPPPARYDVVSSFRGRTLQWSWVLDKGSVPSVNAVPPDLLKFDSVKRRARDARGANQTAEERKLAVETDEADMGGMLEKLGFKSVAATWMFGVDGHVEWPVEPQGEPATDEGPTPDEAPSSEG